MKNLIGERWSQNSGRGHDRVTAAGSGTRPARGGACPSTAAWRGNLRVALLCLIAALPVSVVAATNAAPATLTDEAAEVIQILRARYVDHEHLDTKMLNEAGLDGVLRALGAGAVILAVEPPSTNPPPAAAGPARHAAARAEIIDPNIGYLCLGDLTADTADAVDAALKKFADAKVEGYILDLRFADGTNYEVAAAVASRFLDDGQELFSVKSTDQKEQVFRGRGHKENEVHVGSRLSDSPLMLLVNGQTSGSAEALVAALRAHDRGIVIGGHTAGSAVSWEEAKLSDGRILRIATAKIVVPGSDGEAAFSIFPKGLTPDVPVTSDAKVERDLLFHPATNLTLTASLQPRVPKKHMSEAELVKAIRGEALDTERSATQPEGEIQQVRDVVLQRAVDILKGIRVLLSWE